MAGTRSALDQFSHAGAPSLYRRTRRPDLIHPRCTHRGRPFDAASIVAVVSRSERPPSHRLAHRSFPVNLSNSHRLSRHQGIADPATSVPALPALPATHALIALLKLTSLPAPAIPGSGPRHPGVLGEPALSSSKPVLSLPKEGISPSSTSLSVSLLCPVTSPLPHWTPAPPKWTHPAGKWTHPGKNWTHSAENRTHPAKNRTHRPNGVDTCGDVATTRRHAAPVTLRSPAESPRLSMSPLAVSTQ